MVQSGFLVLAKLGGFDFSSTLAPPHRAELADRLLGAVTQSLGPAFRARRRPDSVLATLPDGALWNPSVVLDLVDQGYLAFRSLRRRLEESLTCTCGACRAISRVELSFVVHHGRWRPTPGGRRRGPDVAIARWLARGARAAASRLLLTETALERTGIDPAAAGMTGREELADELPFRWVASELESVWRAADARGGRLEPSDVMLTVESVLPMNVLEAWEWMIEPDKRALWEELHSVTQLPRPDRRVGTGTRYRSRMGTQVDETWEIVDWRPFRGWTWDARRGGATIRSTVELHDHAEGTRVENRFGVPPGTRLLQRIIARREIGQRIAGTRAAALSRLRAMLEVERQGRR